MQQHSKVLIIGSGPAAYSAAIYTARAMLEPTLVTGMQPGGQLMITTEVENYPGFVDIIQGPWLMEQMEGQAKKVGTKVVNDHIKAVDFSSFPLKAYGESGTAYTTDSIIIATGAQAKWLGLPSEAKFSGHGVSGCATCDGFFFRNKKVMVVGGGNTAVEEALYLTNHTSDITLVHRRDSLRAEKMLQQKLFSNSKIKVIWNSEVEEILGEGNPSRVTGVKLRNNKDQSITEHDFEGVFIAIGHSPNTDIFKDWLRIDEEGYIITEPGTPNTTIKGVFAAGDVQDKIYRQAVTAAGTGCMAALEATKFLSDHPII